MAAVKAAFSTASAYRVESDPRPPSQKQTPRTGRRLDPLDGIFEKEAVPLLVESPSLRAVTIFDELCRRYPELPAGVRRTLERRVRRWRALHSGLEQVGKLCGQRCLATAIVGQCQQPDHAPAGERRQVFSIHATRTSVALHLLPGHLQPRPMGIREVKTRAEHRIGEP